MIALDCPSSGACKVFNLLGSGSKYRSNVHQRFDLFHIGGLVRSTVNLLLGCGVVVIAQALITNTNAEAHIDHAVAEDCELLWLVQLES
jgi:hypothetical protein